MSDKKEDQKGSFWTTLPGIITAIAALITAIGGFIAVLNTMGVFDPSPTNTPAAATRLATEPPAQSATDTLVVVETSTQSPTEASTVTSYPSEITDSKGVPMVLVPSGEFEMGSDKENNERPVHTVHLDGFYIDKFEVTNTLYRACVAVSACEKPKNTSHYNRPEYANHPVVFVDWEMANAYCEWRGTRLPTEAQWEKTARGTIASIYPWGNTVDTTFANYLNILRDTSEVGSYDSGQSVYGAYDLAGNVWEWVADRYAEDYYFTLPPIAENPTGPGPASGNFRVIRGGSYNDDANAVRSSNRAGLDLSSNGTDLGIRCARNANP